MIAFADALEILPWVLPVILGAIIGYLTNSVAIRMLFRPIRPIRVFGLRLPFTPGVIPRRRSELAESIGRMVARDLLTDDVFYQRFSDPGFRVGLQRGIAGGLRHLEGMKLALLMQLTGVQQMVKYAGRWILQTLSGVEGRRIRTALSQWVASGVAGQNREIARAVVALLENTRPFAPVTSDDISRVVDANWSVIVDEIDRILHRTEVQQELDQRVRRIIRYSLEQLTSMQRFLVSAAQYDRQIESRIPLIVDRIVSEVLTAVQEEENRHRIIAMVEGWLEHHRDRTVGSLISPDTREQVQAVIARYLGDRERVAEDIDSQLELLIERMNDDDAATRLSELIGTWVSAHGDDRVGDLVPIIGRRRSVMARFAAGRVQRILSGLTRLFLEQLDVYSIVVDRINSLEVERVEMLLLGIIKRHLRWINAFGAILGGMIGAIQVVLRLAGMA